jgi:hypothetical protein
MAVACRAEADCATAEAGIELIDRTHAPDRPRVVGLIEQAGLHTARWRQIEKRDARLLAAMPRLENDAECRHRCRDQLAGVGRRHGQAQGLEAWYCLCSGLMVSIQTARLAVTRF